MKPSKPPFEKYGVLIVLGFSVFQHSEVSKKVWIFSESEHSYARRTFSSNLTPDISPAINAERFLFFCLSSDSRLIIPFFTNVGKKMSPAYYMPLMLNSNNEKGHTSFVNMIPFVHLSQYWETEGLNLWYYIFTSLADQTQMVFQLYFTWSKKCLGR